MLNRTSERALFGKISIDEVYGTKNIDNTDGRPRNTLAKSVHFVVINGQTEQALEKSRALPHAMVRSDFRLAWGR